ncbi:MAG: TolC family protein, partial [Thermoguttaceae bacterium]|nr:TolC family protein [Thermoguttaceae bacterium]
QTAEEHYSDSERMFDVGLLTRNVVLAAQVALSETRQTELKVANAQQLAEAAYNRLLWRPLDAPVVIADVELGAPLGDLETLTSQAVQTRGELQVLSAESRALQEQVRVARADVLPQVAVVGAYSYFENSHLRDNSNATAAVGLTWTPIDGGTSRARQNAARQNAMAVARVRDEAESGIRLQVRQAWLAEQEARERVEVARVAVEQAEENLRVVTRGFQEGAVNHTETLDAATMRTAAKSNYTNACYDAILATQRLRYAVGIL